MGTTDVDLYSHGLRADNVAPSDEVFNPADGNNMGARPDDSLPGGIAYPAPDYAMLPGYVTRGYQETGSPDSFSGPWDDIQSAAYSFRELSALTTDPSIDGKVGQANRNPYAAYGPAESNTVEDFEMRGEWYKVRRQPDAHPGPVGYSDYSGYLAAALASDAYPAISDSSSQFSIATGV